MGKSAEKTLVISIYTDKAPDFDFKGSWTGADMSIVQRQMVRAYYQYQRDMRHLDEKNRVFAEKKEKFNLTQRANYYLKPENQSKINALKEKDEVLYNEIIRLLHEKKSELKIPTQNAEVTQNVR